MKTVMFGMVNGEVETFQRVRRHHGPCVCFIHEESEVANCVETMVNHAAGHETPKHKVSYVLRRNDIEHHASEYFLPSCRANYAID